MFQCVKKHNCAFGMCVCVFLKADKQLLFFLFEEREKLVCVISSIAKCCVLIYASLDGSLDNMLSFLPII